MYFNFCLLWYLPCIFTKCERRITLSQNTLKNYYQPQAKPLEDAQPYPTQDEFFGPEEDWGSDPLAEVYGFEYDSGETGETGDAFTLAGDETGFGFEGEDLAAYGGDVDGLGDLGLDESLDAMEASGEEGYLVADVQELKDRILADEDLEDSVKEDLLERIEVLMGQASLLDENDDEALDGFYTELGAIEQAFMSFEDLPANVYDLARTFRVEPLDMARLAGEAGLDLANLPYPPTQEILTFLVKLNPDVAEWLGEIEELKQDKLTAAGEAASEVNRITEHNTSGSDSNSNDIKDVSNHQFLFDAKYFQTEYDKDITRLQEKVQDELIDLLEELYPDEKIRRPRGSDVDYLIPGEDQGRWRRAAQDYIRSDKIEFGDLVFDFVNSETGETQWKTSYDVEPEIQAATVYYDNEGDGQWKPDTVTTYGDPVPAKTNYDPNAGGVSMPW